MGKTFERFCMLYALILSKSIDCQDVSNVQPTLSNDDYIANITQFW